MLHFADDLFLFAEARVDPIVCIKDALSKFCKASCHMINYNKFLIYFSPNLSEQDTYALSLRMGVPKRADLGAIWEKNSFFRGGQIVYTHRCFKELETSSEVRT